MQFRPLGAAGIQASVVGLGTWAIGGWNWGITDENEAIKAIHAAIDAGITLIDTAPVYGFGLSEEIVGKALAGRRDKVVLANKCGVVWHCKKGEYHFLTHWSPDGKNDKPIETYQYLAPESIRYELEQSLSRLKTDYIDLYQTHWQDPTTPIAETMGALLDLKKEGKIRAIGVSNASVEQMDEYRKFGDIDSDQEKFNMIDRKAEPNNLPYCHQHNIAVLSYSTLEFGLLTGKISPDREFPKGDLRRGNEKFKPENLAKISAMLDEMKPIAEKNSLTMTQLMIAWTIAQTGLTHALVGARTPAYAIENAAAGNQPLSAEDVADVDRIFGKHASNLP